MSAAAAAQPVEPPALPVATTGEHALAVAERLVREAGALVAGHAGRSPTVHEKGLGDVVTAADRAAEAFVLDGLAAAFPDHGLLRRGVAARHRLAQRLRLAARPDRRHAQLQPRHPALLRDARARA